MDNLIYNKRYDMDFANSDMYGRLKPSALLRMFQEASSEANDSIGKGWQAAAARGALWVLVRVRAELYDPPVFGERVTISTWPGRTRVAFMPRHYAIESESGRVLGRGVGVWMFMDVETRKLGFPSQYGIIMPEYSREGELAFPGRIRFPALTRETLRQAHYSDADMNGHMNNVRYMDWMCDLPEPGFFRQRRVSALQLNFESEVRLDEDVKMQWQLTDGALHARASHADTHLFDCVIETVPAG